MFKQKIEKDLIKAVVDLGFVKPNDTVFRETKPLFGSDQKSKRSSRKSGF